MRKKNTEAKKMMRRGPRKPAELRRAYIVHVSKRLNANGYEIFTTHIPVAVARHFGWGASTSLLITPTAEGFTAGPVPGAKA